MNALPDWTWACLAILTIGYVLVYLRALAAVAHDILAVHTLQHQVSTIRIRQVKQLKAIRYGLHPGDVFGSEDRLDELLAIARQESIEAEQAAPVSKKKHRAGSDDDTVEGSGPEVNTEFPSPDAASSQTAGSLPGQIAAPMSRAA